MVSFAILILVQFFFPDEFKAEYFILFFVFGLAFSAEIGITSYTSIKIATALGGVSYSTTSNIYKFRTDTVKHLVTNSLSLLICIYVLLSILVTFYLINVSFVSFGVFGIVMTLSVIFLTFINLIQQALYDGVGLLYVYQIRSIMINLLSLLFFCTLTYFEYFHLTIVYYYLVRAFLVCIANHNSILAFDKKLLFTQLSSSSIFQIFKDKFFRRISISWIAGSITFSSVIPIMGLYHDISVINEIGLIFQIFNAILVMSLSWQIGAQPFFVNDWLKSGKQSLIKHVKIVGALSALTSLFLIIFSVGAVSFAAGNHLIKFNGIINLAIILMSLPFLAFSASYIHSIRADQNEIFMEISVATCLLILCSVITTFFLISLNLFVIAFSTVIVIHSLCCYLLSIRYINSKTFS